MDSNLTCMTCLGGGEIIVGWKPATRVSPPEPVFDECPVCWGLGSLKAWERDEMFEAWPTEEEAREMREGRMKTREDVEWDDYLTPGEMYDKPY